MALSWTWRAPCLASHGRDICRTPAEHVKLPLRKPPHTPHTPQATHPGRVGPLCQSLPTSWNTHTRLWHAHPNNNVSCLVAGVPLSHMRCSYPATGAGELPSHASVYEVGTAAWHEGSHVGQFGTWQWRVCKRRRRDRAGLWLHSRRPGYARASRRHLATKLATTRVSPHPPGRSGLHCTEGSDIATAPTTTVHDAVAINISKGIPQARPDPPGTRPRGPPTNSNSPSNQRSCA